jgi:hypothetical protein
MRRIIAAALAAICAGAAFAQTDAQRNPSDPQQRVPAVEYRSAFSDYRPYREPETAKWREANDQVRALGGHKGHVAKTQPAAKPEAPRKEQK